LDPGKNEENLKHQKETKVSKTERTEEKEIEGVGEIIQQRQDLWVAKKSLVNELAELEAELKRLPEDLATLRQQIQDTQPLELTYEQWENLRKKEYYLLDREGRLKSSIGETSAHIADLNKQIHENMAGEVRLRFEALGREWEPERERFLELVAYWKILTSRLSPFEVCTAIFRLNDRATLDRLNKITQQVASRFEQN
jgi:regulator of replication initiation timing